MYCLKSVTISFNIFSGICGFTSFKLLNNISGSITSLILFLPVPSFSISKILSLEKTLFGSINASIKSYLSGHSLSIQAFSIILSVKIFPTISPLYLTSMVPFISLGSNKSRCFIRFWFCFAKLNISFKHVSAILSNFLISLLSGISIFIFLNFD